MFNRYRLRRAVAQSGFWFVDIPRTSSSSVRSELGQVFGQSYSKSNLIEHEFSAPQIWEDHIPGVEMLEILGSRLWEKIYKFSIVRNPWERIHSQYRYQIKVSKVPRDWSFDEYVDRLSNADGTDPYFSYNPLRYRMVDFLMDKNGTLLVDEIVYYEKRSEHLQRIGERIGVPNLGHRHIQSANSPPSGYARYYTDKSRDKVGQLYEEDIRVFGYTFH